MKIRKIIKTIIGKTYFSRIILSGILFLLIFSNCRSVGKKISIPGEKRITVSIDPAKARTFSKNIFGVNSLMSHPPISYLNTDLAQKYIDLGSRVIRYPGGTSANFYNFKTGYNDVPAKKADPKHHEQMKGANSRIKTTKGDIGGYNIEHFVTFVEKTGTEVSMVLNLCTQDEKYTRNLMELFKQKNVNIKYVEMGNEVYFNLYEGNIESVEEYIKRAKKHTAEVKRVFPSALVGIVVVSQSFNELSYFKESKRRISKRVMAWDRALARENFYDSVIIHMYGNTGVQNDVKKENVPSNQKIFQNAISHVDYQFSKTFQYLKKLFPGKQLWVTEWQIGGFRGIMRKHRFRYSYLGALYSINFFQKLLHLEGLHLANLHSYTQLVEIRYGRGVNQLASKNNDLTLPTMPNYHAMKLYKHAIHNYSQVIKVKIDGPGKYTGLHPYKGKYDEVTGSFFHGEKDGILFIINKYKKEYSLKDVEIEGKKSKIKKITVMTSMNGHAGLDKEEIDIREVPYKDGQSITLPPYSVLRIEYEL